MLAPERRGEHPMRSSCAAGLQGGEAAAVDHVRDQQGGAPFQGLQGGEAASGRHHA